MNKSSKTWWAQPSRGALASALFIGIWASASAAHADAAACATLVTKVSALEPYGREANAYVWVDAGGGAVRARIDPLETNAYHSFFMSRRYTERDSVPSNAAANSSVVQMTIGWPHPPRSPSPAIAFKGCLKRSFLGAPMPRTTRRRLLSHARGRFSSLV
jgi:hypothetical protein